MITKKIYIPKDATYIIDILEKNGYEAFIVGGCVRDSILGITPHDYDICTDALPQEVLNIFSKTNVYILETGLKHGTLTIIINHQYYEVTTYRIDGEYTDNRHPNEVQFIKNLKEDLARRDFTINAMAYNKKTGLVDFFGGNDDLNNKIIRCVGNADDRFNEDALRILRALRFASTYGYTLSHDVAESIHKNRELLNNIAYERINTELCKMICGTGIENILRDYADIIFTFIPEISPMIGFMQHNPYHIYDVWEHTIKVVINTPSDITLRLSALLHDIGKPLCFTQSDDKIGHFYGHGNHSTELCKIILDRMRFDNDTKHMIKKLVEYHDGIILVENKSIKRWLNKIGVDGFKKLLLLKRADTLAQSALGREKRLKAIMDIEILLEEIITESQCFSIENLAIDGNDLISNGIPQGKEIGIILNSILDMVLDNKVENKKEELLLEIKKFV